MKEYEVKQLVDKIRMLDAITPPNMSIPLSLESKVLPLEPWDKKLLEKSLEITLPLPLQQLWNEASSLRLFEDIIYGQWGLILWSPTQVLRENRQRISTREEFRPGDLIIGEFLGDSELLLVRCDPAEDDFGYVVIVLPLYPRKEWYIAADSLEAFIYRFLEVYGDKFWEK